MIRHHYRVVVSYNGSNYFGWQDLGDASEKPTIQSEILQVLRKISKYAECVVSGASRTDAGVHALGQVAKLSTPLEIEPAMLRLGMNSLLPADIRIRECSSCPADFNPNRDSRSKTYRYFFSVDEIGNPLLQHLVAHVPLATATAQSMQPGIERMRSACRLFVGEKDFANFAARDESLKTTVRTVLNLELHKSENSDLGGDIYYVEIQGDGFLKYMVRYILGALFALARGDIDAVAIERAIAEPGLAKLSPKAKSAGLQLLSIDY